jgi:hypothetical protein
VPKTKDVDPLKLKRERAGRYLSGDGRFAVESAGGSSWYLVHNERQNELGLPLMEGPFPTLDDARDALRRAAEEPADAAPPSPPAARERRPAKAADGEEATDDARTPTAADARAVQPVPMKPARPAMKPAPEPPSEPAWLTRLEPKEQQEARRLLGLLERLGIDDPTLVRRDVEGNVPEIARLLLARRVREDALDPWRDKETAQTDATDLPARVRRHLRGEIEPFVEAAERLTDSADADDLAAYAWLVAVRTAARIFEALESEGRKPPAPGRPGWRLVEVDPKGDVTGRGLILDESDLLES